MVFESWETKFVVVVFHGNTKKKNAGLFFFLLRFDGALVVRSELRNPPPKVELRLKTQERNEASTMPIFSLP